MKFRIADLVRYAAILEVVDQVDRQLTRDYSDAGELLIERW
jgi:hypothetical protein